MPKTASFKYREHQRIWLLILFGPLLQSCTVFWVDLKNELSPSGAAPPNDCSVQYSVTIVPGSGMSRLEVLETTRRFVDITRDVISSRGCTATYTEDDAGASLRVVAQYTPEHFDEHQMIALLTLFLIPSWATHENWWVYRFTDRTTSFKHAYEVDLKMFSHWIALPVFWVSFFTRDDFGPYKRFGSYRRALTNFVETDAALGKSRAIPFQHDIAVPLNASYRHDVAIRTDFEKDCRLSHDLALDTREALMDSGFDVAVGGNAQAEGVLELEIVGALVSPHEGQADDYEVTVAAKLFRAGTLIGTFTRTRKQQGDKNEPCYGVSLLTGLIGSDIADFVQKRTFDVQTLPAR